MDVITWLQHRIVRSPKPGRTSLQIVQSWAVRGAQARYEHPRGRQDTIRVRFLQPASIVIPPGLATPPLQPHTRVDYEIWTGGGAEYSHVISRTGERLVFTGVVDAIFRFSHLYLVVPENEPE